MALVLIIDDDEQVRLVLRRTLQAAGYDTIDAADGRQGLELFQAAAVDLIITDIYMPEKEGLETILELRQTHPQLPIIAVSGGSREADIDFLPVAERLGASAAFSKPIDRDALLSKVAELLGGG